jgi:hypothetical protein
MSRKSAKTQSKQAERPAGDAPEEQGAEQRDWGDEVAQARTADDPRTVAPHDRGGRPSTGETI